MKINVAKDQNELFFIARSRLAVYAREKIFMISWSDRCYTVFDLKVSVCLDITLREFESR